MECRDCGKPYEPTANDLRKSDFQCAACRQAYKRRYSKRRKAQGFSVSGTTWKDPAKAAAWYKAYRARPEVKEKWREYQRRYRNDPDTAMRRAARLLVRRAIERGELKRMPCVRCGKKKTEAHHEDYTKPLDVMWLCKSCHWHQHYAKAEGK